MHSKKVITLVLALFVFIFLFTSLVFAQNGFLTGTGSWSGTGPTTLSWSVQWNGISSTAHYDYTFTVNQHDISFFLLEVSDSFDTANSSDISNLYVTGTGGVYTLNNTQTYSPGNPYYTMPGGITAIKFDGFDNTSQSTTTLSISFDSTRMPEWGDFYARCGVRTEHTSGEKPWNSAWNTGFISGETAGAGNDAIALNHLLVPNTAPLSGGAFSYSGTLVLVPEPVSTVLFIMGGGLLAGRRYFRRER